MSFEPEKMTVETMQRLLNDAYNGVTFKNALVCALDWCNWYRCTNIHKDVRIGVNANGYPINKYEKVKPQPGDNPHTNRWYEKHDKTVTYSAIATSKLTYWDNPKSNKWYERVSTDPDVYEESQDTYATGEYLEVTPNTGDSPKALGWYVISGTTYIPSTDNNVVGGRTYYMCAYKTYYKKTEKKETTYVRTMDETVVEGKKYYQQKNPEEYRDLPDYSSHYTRNIDITIPGVEDEITLNNKRPVTVSGG